LIIFYIIVQELFVKLTGVAGIASDVFVGRERFATILLMRLAEAVILWLSDDQDFWANVETGQTPLGPLGLQQVDEFIESFVCDLKQFWCYTKSLSIENKVLQKLNLET
jgi:hypothetical protein